MGLLSTIGVVHPCVGPVGLGGLVMVGVETAAGALDEATGEVPSWRVVDEGPNAWLVRNGRWTEFIRPMPHQVEAWEHPASSKLFREGRRTGKTRRALRSAISGHGPEGTWSQGDGVFRREWTGHKHRGVLSGMDVVWIARDFKQANVLWFEEVRPKWKGQAGIVVNETDRWVHFEGGGTLWIRSADNIDSVRGLGDRLVGAVVDEAAFLDLERALKEVLLPALSDNEGWLILMSTTNAGRDGNPERPAGPSYFNMLCEQVIAGERSDEWAQFHGTARDNPRITAKAFAKLCSEYAVESHSYQQEVEAKLLKGLHGLQFTEWRDDLLIRDIPLDALGGWNWRAGLDWGFTSAGWFGLGAFGPKGREHLYAEVPFNGEPVAGDNLPPYEVGKLVGRALEVLPQPDRIVADSAMWATGDGRGGRHVSDAEEFQRGLDEILGPHGPRLIKSTKGVGSPATRAKLFHQSIRFTEIDEVQDDGSVRRIVPPWGMPKFSVARRCKTFIRYVPALPVDPGDADRVDTTAHDHEFDGWTYLTIARPQHAKPRETTASQHQHPGLEKYLEPTAPANERRWTRT